MVVDVVDKGMVWKWVSKSKEGWEWVQKTWKMLENLYMSNDKVHIWLIFVMYWVCWSQSLFVIVWWFEGNTFTIIGLLVSDFEGNDVTIWELHWMGGGWGLYLDYVIYYIFWVLYWDCWFPSLRAMMWPFESYIELEEVEGKQFLLRLPFHHTRENTFNKRFLGKESRMRNTISNRNKS